MGYRSDGIAPFAFLNDRPVVPAEEVGVLVPCDSSSANGGARLKVACIADSGIDQVLGLDDGTEFCDYLQATFRRGVMPPPSIFAPVGR